MSAYFWGNILNFRYKHIYEGLSGTYTNKSCLCTLILMFYCSNLTAIRVNEYVQSKSVLKLMVSGKISQMFMVWYKAFYP